MGLTVVPSPDLLPQRYGQKLFEVLISSVLCRIIDPIDSIKNEMHYLLCKQSRKLKLETK